MIFIHKITIMAIGIRYHNKSLHLTLDHELRLGTSPVTDIQTITVHCKGYDETSRNDMVVPIQRLDFRWCWRLLPVFRRISTTPKVVAATDNKSNLPM